MKSADRAPMSLGIIGLGMASLPHAKSIVALQEAGRVLCKAAWSPSRERRQRSSLGSFFNSAFGMRRYEPPRWLQAVGSAR